MRDSGDPELTAFLQQVGSGTSESTEGVIQHDGAYLLELLSSIRVFVNEQEAREWTHTIDPANTVQGVNRALLCAHNISTQEHNKCYLDMIEGVADTAIATNIVSDKFQAAGPEFTSAEYLATIEDYGAPTNTLHLKPGCLLHCIKNLLRVGDEQNRLINGTPLRYISHTPRLMIVENLSAADNRRLFLPRVSFKIDHSTLTFIRKQFPVQLAYARTINKAQGKTLDRVCVDLRNPVFAHGQLYVALSRVHHSKDLAVLVNPSSITDQGKCFIVNVVWPELLGNPLPPILPTESSNLANPLDIDVFSKKSESYIDIEVDSSVDMDLESDKDYTYTANTEIDIADFVDVSGEKQPSKGIQTDFIEHPNTGMSISMNLIQNNHEFMERYGDKIETVFGDDYAYLLEILSFDTEEEVDARFNVSDVMRNLSFDFVREFSLEKYDEVLKNSLTEDLMIKKKVYWVPIGWLQMLTYDYRENDYVIEDFGLYDWIFWRVNYEDKHWVGLFHSPQNESPVYYWDTWGNVAAKTTRMKEMETNLLKLINIVGKIHRCHWSNIQVLNAPIQAINGCGMAVNELGRRLLYDEDYINFDLQQLGIDLRIQQTADILRLIQFQQMLKSFQ